MKRLNLQMACLALGVLAILAQLGEAGQKKNKPKPIDPPPANAAASEDAATFLNGIFKLVDMETSREAAANATEASVVAQLVEIMNETKSPQTVLAVTMALMPMGKKAQSAVPAIIRNAERLKVFAPLKDMNSAKAENATVILTAIMAIQMDLPLTKDMLGFPGSPFGLERSPYGYPPAGPACPQPIPSYQSLPPTLTSPVCPDGPLSAPCVRDPLIGLPGSTGPVQPPCRVKESPTPRAPSSLVPTLPHW
jgi:hypothetical protein